MNEYTHLDLCSGTGAFSIGFEREGFQTIGFSEIDPYCCKLLAQNWPTVTNYGDIRNVPTVRCSVATAGFPCQPVSVAGRRKGEADHRWLWPAVLDAVERCQPTYFLGENVVGITNLLLAQCQDDLEGIGYQSQAFDIPSCAVGLSSVERHVWIVAAHRKVELQRRGEECVQGGGLQFSLGGKADATLAPLGRMPDLPNTRLLRSTKGVPHFRDRIAAIGNAVPPPIAQIFARAIFQALASQR